MLPESTLIGMSLTEYKSFLAQNPPIPTSNPEAEMVRNIGAKISTSVIKYMKQTNNSKRIEGYKWEFNLVNNNTPNAWCMPGGKVVVYSGLLPLTKTEAGLAFVMGHEIAHAVARHGNERMSQGLITQMGGVALDVALSEKSAQTRALFSTAYGLSTTVGAILPFSRLHETEADQMGMIFMAMAGYDPREASAVWERMSSAGGPSVPEFLSTHPSDQTRINNIKEFLPEALKYYKP